MTTLLSKASSRLSILETLNVCRENHLITSNRYQELLIELKLLSKEFVLKFNHKKSSTISKKNYQRILDTISYHVNHSMMEISKFKSESIRTFYSQGNLEVEKDIHEIKEIYNQLVISRLRVENDRYNSIIDEQIPRFLKSLDEYRGEFNRCHTDEDLDYPLIDGIPLDHDMYKVDGTDLVLYYLNRFKIENDFCNLFKLRIYDLVKQYEVCKDIEISLLNINLCELCLIQYVANRTIQKIDLVLEENEVQNIRLLSHRYRQRINEVYEEMKIQFGKDIVAYLELFKENIMRQFDLFYRDEIELLVYNKILDDKYCVYLTDTKDSVHFELLFNAIQSINTTKGKVEYMQTKQIGLFDILDLFDHEIFYDDEFSAYFLSCTNQQLALFVKIACPNAGKFNMKVEFNKSFYDDFNLSVAWQMYLAKTLQSIHESDRMEIEELVRKIRIVMN